MKANVYLGFCALSLLMLPTMALAADVSTEFAAPTLIYTADHLSAVANIQLNADGTGTYADDIFHSSVTWAKTATGLTLTLANQGSFPSTDADGVAVNYSLATVDLADEGTTAPSIHYIAHYVTNYPDASKPAGTDSGDVPDLQPIAESTLKPLAAAAGSLLAIDFPGSSSVISLNADGTVAAVSGADLKATAWKLDAAQGLAITTADHTYFVKTLESGDLSQRTLVRDQTADGSVYYASAAAILAPDYSKTTISSDEVVGSYVSRQISGGAYRFEATGFGYIADPEENTEWVFKWHLDGNKIVGERYQDDQGNVVLDLATQQKCDAGTLTCSVFQSRTYTVLGKSAKDLLLERDLTQDDQTSSSLDEFVRQ